MDNVFNPRLSSIPSNLCVFWVKEWRGEGGRGVGENVRAGENDLVKRQNQEPITLLTEWTTDETVIRVSYTCIALFHISYHCYG